LQKRPEEQLKAVVQLVPIPPGVVEVADGGETESPLKTLSIIPVTPQAIRIIA